MMVEMKDDRSDGLITFKGMRELLRSKGIPITKVQSISGLARNTVVKSLDGAPVRRATAEHLFRTLVNAGLITSDDSSDVPQSNITQFKRTIDVRQEEVGETTDYEGDEAETLTQRAYEYADPLAKILEELVLSVNEDERAVSRDQISLLLHKLNVACSAKKTIERMLKF
jgi:ferredoxin-fold anticodon binding domain-containing protein